MEFQGKYKLEGFDFGDNRDRILKHCTHNVGKRFILADLLPESRKQRKFFEGAVITLWIYLDGNDYKNTDLQRQYHEYAKLEFNPEVVIISGQQRKVGGSSKGKLGGNDGVVNKVIDFLEEQYGIDRTKCLSPKDYKHFKDKIFMNGNYDTYIDYMIDLKKVPIIPKN